jgi:L-threonylcarbamoyladenylate synthase
MIYDNDIKNSIKVLREGGVILYPTDTIWGLGCDATNPEAVGKIFSIKQREDSKSLIVLVNGIGMLERYIREIPPAALNILEVTETPVTIVYPGAKNLAMNLVAGDGSVGIRIPHDDFCLRLIEQFRKPIVSTSANISGENPPAHFGEISGKITEGADYIAEYRRDDRQKRRPSPVIKIEVSGVISIIRK